MSLYSTKSEQYFTNARDDAISLLPTAPLGDVLEIGCGSGATLALLKQQGRARFVCGVDAFAVPDVAAAPFIDQFLNVDIDAALVSSQRRFDLILALDVLEHLVDPWRVVQLLAERANDDALIVASVPNVRHWSVLRDLVLRGRWDYKNDGILDQTHLRFFVRRSVEQLLTAAGFELVNTVSRFRLYPDCTTFRIDRLTFGLMRDVLTAQYLVVARKRRP